MTERDFTDNENNLFIIRNSALKAINTDTLFKRYADTNLNLIPIISGIERKVYILTGPQKSGTVIFGNDYLLNFDSNNNLIKTKHLHKNIIPINYGDSKDKDVIETMHMHSTETGEFITATDICTLMLYEKIANWKRHTVVSKNFISFWNCQTNQLAMLSKKAIDRIDLLC